MSTTGAVSTRGMELFTECSSGNDQYRFEHMNSKAEDPIDVTNLSRALQSLVIIGQPLYTVPDIQYLMFLEDLWLVDCNIHNADHIKKCQYLRRLYLYSNALQKIPDSISCLQQLKVLWLAGNEIVNIYDYEFPPNLEELNLADNKITTIKGAFKKCNSLIMLNLSGNPLKSIFEVCHLRVIKNLKILSLYDSLYDISGITQLCNYRSFIINILPNLEQLDSFVLEEKQMELTKIFYLNKHVYYAMKKMEAYYEYWTCKEQQYCVEKEELVYIKKKYQSLSTKCINVNNENENSDLSVTEELKLILQKELNCWESHCRNGHKEIEELLKLKISNLEMELQYFGNIKFQTFSKNSEVTAECQEILNSFICPCLKKQNVKRIDVAFVTFVINANQCVHEGAQFMLDIFEEQEHGELFIICEPDYIQSSYELFYAQLRNSFLCLQPSNQHKTITQCFVKADNCFKVKTARDNGRKLQTTRRIASLGFFHTDSRSVPQADNSLHKCEMRTINGQEKFTPILLIEFSYYFEEEDMKINLTGSEQYFNVAGRPKSKLSAFENSHLGFKSWYSLTKLAVPHQNLSSFESGFKIGVFLNKNSKEDNCFIPICNVIACVAAPITKGSVRVYNSPEKDLTDIQKQCLLISKRRHH